MVSESKKFSTEMAWHVVNHAMQAMGGIAYTNVYPIERIAARHQAHHDLDRHQRDHEPHHPARAVQGTRADVKAAGRDVEFDAPEAFNEEEKIFE